MSSVIVDILRLVADQAWALVLVAVSVSAWAHGVRHKKLLEAQRKHEERVEGRLREVEDSLPPRHRLIPKSSDRLLPKVTSELDGAHNAPQDESQTKPAPQEDGRELARTTAGRGGVGVPALMSESYD